MIQELSLPHNKSNIKCCRNSNGAEISRTEEPRTRSLLMRKILCFWKGLVNLQTEPEATA